MLNYTLPNFSDTKQLARLFSNSSFRALYSDDNSKKTIYSKISRLINSPSNQMNLKMFFEKGFQQLKVDYRNEYFVKSVLLNDFVLKRYSLNNSVLLNEFQVASSIADVVLVNGSNKVFEIKTEFDSPKRLITQIMDYKKAFSEVFVVVHNSQIEKYLESNFTEIGILSFSETGDFKEIRPAKKDITMLDIRTMAKTLRKSELNQMVFDLTAELPEATQVKFFKICVEIIEKFSPEEVQYKYLQILKKRIDLSSNQRVLSDQTPYWLKFFCYTENIKEKDYLHLLNSLDMKI